ncbi:hypothetical protein NLM31_12785 [Bradyrhizobium sp. CCGUVB4N]|uniref:hypothetical protein n=1 Tax=Bradyrhizobium sp. CCGUVB4N TaxID=2949631 RepID=UPI0020B1C542|nr:hypothetical protein [Bradyrhizobium sp. CCGUVB4N]MCP3381216.1 hypothetical protein [Bradyrhizobium sp. CCGUVB4N]
MNRKHNRRGRATAKLAELEGYQQIGRAVCALLRQTPAYDPEQPTSKKAVKARRFGLKITAALMKQVPEDGFGSHLLVDASFGLWKYKPFAETVTDDDDVPF